MKYFYKKIPIILGFGILLSACEIPKEPDFTLSSKVEAPILFNKSYQFLGGSGSLIDTTSSDFDSLFVTAPDGSISLSTTQDFDFGDLNDAIPAINVDPVSFSAEVGELTLGSFSSGSGDLGSTNFEAISGSFAPPTGTPIPAGDNSANPVNIPIGNNTDFFQSATIKNGSLDLTITNNLGFDISTLTVTLKSAGTQIGTSASFANFTSGSTETSGIVFTTGDQLSQLSVDVVISWIGFDYPANPGDLIIRSAEGNNLIASEVVAALEQQDFSTVSTSQFDNTEFNFTQPSHFIELESGNIRIAPIVNALDLGLEVLRISFPSIRNCAVAQDSLVISYEGANAIQSGATAPAANIDLSGCSIFAENNEVTYSVTVLTENTQAANRNVTLNETDFISTSVEISDLVIARAFGILTTKELLLGDDDLSNGENIIDLFNDIESELTEISGIEDLSEQLEGLEFANPIINIDYTTNIGIEATVYGALLGIAGNGTQIFLTGNPGSQYEVVAGDPITGLQANGVQLSPEQLVKFSLATSSDGSLITSAVSFNNQTTNVADFLNNLPSNIRFIGRAVINESGGEATVTTPIEFNPTLSVDLPLAFSTSPSSSFSDTLDVDAFKDLPSTEKGDDNRIIEGRILIGYSNELPLGVILNLQFLDALNNEITTLPLDLNSRIELLAAPIDATTSFSSSAAVDELVISLNEQQLNTLYRATRIKLTANLNTTNNGIVRLRATDTITLSVAAQISAETKVGGN